MNLRLTDEDVAEIRALGVEGGLSLSAIGERYGTSKQHVSRLLHGEQRQLLPVVDVWGGGSVVIAVARMLEVAGYAVDEDVGAATAMALAEKLDAVRRADTAQSAMAAPGLAKQLAATLGELREQAGDVGPRLGALRGDEAVLVARELGYPHPGEVDVEWFDELEVIRLRYVRRLATQLQKGRNEHVEHE